MLGHKKQPIIEGVDAGSLVELKASLFEAENERKLNKDNRKGKKNKGGRLSFRTNNNTNNVNKNLPSNKDVNSRRLKDELFMKQTHGLTEAEMKRKMEAKSELYERLRNGEVGGNAASVLIDFERKQWKNEEERKKAEEERKKEKEMKKLERKNRKRNGEEIGFDQEEEEEEGENGKEREEKYYYGDYNDDPYYVPSLYSRDMETNDRREKWERETRDAIDREYQEEAKKLDKINTLKQVQDQISDSKKKQQLIKNKRKEQLEKRRMAIKQKKRKLLKQRNGTTGTEGKEELVEEKGKESKYFKRFLIEEEEEEEDDDDDDEVKGGGNGKNDDGLNIEDENAVVKEVRLEEEVDDLLKSLEKESGREEQFKETEGEVFAKNFFNEDNYRNMAPPTQKSNINNGNGSGSGGIARNSSSSGGGGLTHSYYYPPPTYHHHPSSYQQPNPSQYYQTYPQTYPPMSGNNGIPTIPQNKQPIPQKVAPTTVNNNNNNNNDDEIYDPFKI